MFRVQGFGFRVQGLGSSDIIMGVSENRGTPFGGPFDTLFGGIKGVFLLWEMPILSASHVRRLKHLLKSTKLSVHQPLPRVEG